MKYRIGQIIYDDTPIVINKGRKTETLLVTNTGDRAIQVGSHYHFFEVNKALKFDRERAFGMHLDIPAGTAVRFEPGIEKEVEVVEYSGKKAAYGFNGLTNGDTTDPEIKKLAMERAKAKGFL